LAVILDSKIDGNILLGRFVLNTNFTGVEVFGANTTDGGVGDEIVAGGRETGGSGRGPAFQVWDKDGNFLLGRFVLNANFTEVRFAKIDINNDGVDEIVIVGKETGGLARGPAFQVWDSTGNLLVGQFVLNANFSNLEVFVVDQDGDGDEEIGVGGVETTGLARGPAFQVWESNGTFLLGRFVLNPDF